MFLDMPITPMSKIFVIGKWSRSRAFLQAKPVARLFWVSQQGISHIPQLTKRDFEECDFEKHDFLTNILT